MYHLDIEEQTRALAAAFARQLPQGVGKEESERVRAQLQKQFQQALRKMEERVARELGGDNKYNADGSLKV